MNRDLRIGSIEIAGSATSNFISHCRNIVQLYSVDHCCGHGLPCAHFAARVGRSALYHCVSTSHTCPISAIVMSESGKHRETT